MYLFTKKPKEESEEVVKCEECKRLLLKADAQEVIIWKLYCSPEQHYYCSEHKKPYDKIVSSGGIVKVTQINPYGYGTAYFKKNPEYTEVDEKGREIKK